MTSNMPYWTHLIRFVAIEDGQIHLGQLIDSSRDIGQDSISGVSIKAYRIEGTVYSGRVTEEVLQVSRVCANGPKIQPI